MRLRDESGNALIIILIVLAVLALLGIGTCIYWSYTPPWYHVIEPAKQDPDDVVVTGPATLTPGQPGTFNVKVTFPSPLHATQAFFVKVEIYEDDLGDVLLDRSVLVSIPGGATEGSADFVLTCEDENGGLILKGDNGYNTYDATWEVFGYVPDQSTSYSEEGGNHEVSCAGETE